MRFDYPRSDDLIPLDAGCCLLLDTKGPTHRHKTTTTRLSIVAPLSRSLVQTDVILIFVVSNKSSHCFVSSDGAFGKGIPQSNRNIGLQQSLPKNVLKYYSSMTLQVTGM